MNINGVTLLGNYVQTHLLWVVGIYLMKNKCSPNIGCEMVFSPLTYTRLHVHQTINNKIHVLSRHFIPCMLIGSYSKVPLSLLAYVYSCFNASVHVSVPLTYYIKELVFTWTKIVVRMRATPKRFKEEAGVGGIGSSVITRREAQSTWQGCFITKSILMRVEFICF
jgi:hypothetical protein